MTLNLSLIGELAEWSNASVLKTEELKGSVGSNPTLTVSPAIFTLQLLEEL